MKKLTFTIAALLTATTAMADPNNYIRTDNNGVIYEQDHGSTARSNFNGNIITRDMATQEELDNATRNTVSQGDFNLSMQDIAAELASVSAGAAAMSSIQMDPSHRGAQVGVGLGYADSQYEGAVGLGVSLGDNSFGYMAVDTQGTVGASINWRF